MKLEPGKAVLRPGEGGRFKGVDLEQTLAELRWIVHPGSPKARPVS